MSLRKYQYRTINQSLLSPHFRKYVVDPTIALIPFGLTANIITIFSNLLLYVAVVFALNRNANSEWLIMAPMLVFFYLYGDHLDGAQAKRTKSSSALGEFNDHYLDTFNTGLLLWLLFLIMDIKRPEIVLGSIAISYLAHSSLIYAQFETGWLRFEKIGSFEAVTLIITLLLLSCNDTTRSILLSTIYGNLSLIEMVIIFSMAGTLISLLISLKRIQNISKKYISFLVLLPVVSLELYFLKLSQTFSILILIGFCVIYMGRLMIGHLVDGKHRWPDFLTPLILPIAVIIPSVPLLIYLIILYQILQIVLIVTKIYTVFGSEWVWWNR